MRYIIFLFPFLLIGCSDLPPIFMPHDDAKGKTTKAEVVEAEGPSRQVLEVPPELRGKISVPTPNKIASVPEHVSTQRVEKEIGEPISAPVQGSKEAVAGKHITLDTRLYEQDTASVFSAVVDAMTSLNLPVQSVDSPSGVVTTDWVRSDANTLNKMVATALGSGANMTRYRHVVRVLKSDQGKTLLQVRTLGQSYVNRHWANRQLKRKMSEELFSAVEERL